MSSELSRGESIKALIGNKHRLDIRAAVGKLSIDPPEPFYTGQLQESLEGVPRSAVPHEIELMISLGMIKPSDQKGFREGQQGGQAPNWLERCESPYWELFELAARIIEVEYPNSGT